MSFYTAKYRLTSCKVTTELIRELEKFILGETKVCLLKAENTKEIEDYEAAAKEMFHISILEKDETVKYTSIDEFKDEKLPDGTKSVILEFTSMVEKFFQFKVIFHSSISEHPVLEIAIADRNAKEICKPIVSGITKIIKENRNYNSIFHNRYVQVGLILLYTLYNVYTFFNLTGFVEVEPGPLSLAGFIVFSVSFGFFILWYILSIFMRRYTTFDTARQKMINTGYYVTTVIVILGIVYYVYHSYSVLHPAVSGAVKL